MRNELDQIQYIENYLNGKLTADEQVQFENQLKTDENLRANTELQKQLTERIKINAFRNEVMLFHEQLGAKVTSWSLKGIWLNSLLGVLLVGSLSAGVYYYSGKNEVPQKS